MSAIKSTLLQAAIIIPVLLYISAYGGSKESIEDTIELLPQIDSSLEVFCEFEGRSVALTST